MTVSEAIQERRSIRKYKADVKITQEQIDALLTAAMLAPSAKNARPWEFVVVESREVIDKLHELHPYTGMLSTAALAIVVCGIPSGGDVEFYHQDCGASIENLLLEAVELGLGCCWCGLHPEQERSYEVQKLIGVSSVPSAIIAVGVPDEAPKAKGFYDKEKVKYIK